MVKKLKKLIFILRNPRIFKMLMNFYWDGYLRQIGWFNAYQKQTPVNHNNEPIPWVTYSFIDFIQERLNKTMTLVEYGSGASTLFYGNLVKKVFTVEHNQIWFNQISKNLPSNIIINHVELIYGGEYSDYANNINVSIDVVIVDGRDRVNCVKKSLCALSEEGVIVLDDSERKEYNEAKEFLKKNSFKQIDFWGISPGLFYKKCTSLFYREKNCIGI